MESTIEASPEEQNFWNAYFDEAITPTAMHDSAVKD